jgi:hypothetical protein
LIKYHYRHQPFWQNTVQVKGFGIELERPSEGASGRFNFVDAYYDVSLSAQFIRPHGQID